MNLIFHLVTSAAFAGLMFPHFGYSSALIFAGGFFIDIDHYLWYAYRYRDFSILRCYRHFTKRDPKDPYKVDEGNLHLFHTIEFFLSVVLLSFYEPARLFALGLILHSVLDVIWLATVPKRIILNHSVISWLVKNRRTVKT